MTTLQSAGRIGWARERSSSFKWMIVVAICAAVAAGAIATTLAVVDSSPAAPIAPAVGEPFSVDADALQRFHADNAKVGPAAPAVSAPTVRQMIVDEQERRLQLRHEKTRTP